MFHPQQSVRWHVWATLVAVLLSAFSITAQAAPDEITVFTDEFAKPRHTEYELHLNYTPKSRCVPARSGTRPHLISITEKRVSAVA